MAIDVGSRMPDGTLIVIGDDGPRKVEASDFFGGRKIVLFGVPGAFSPTCSNTHMPGFVENADAFRAKGVDEIALIGVNDPFVMKAWREASGAGDAVTFLADGNADYSRALGMDIDASAGNMGTRCRRFAAIVEDGTVRELGLEDGPKGVTASGAEAMLGKL